MCARFTLHSPGDLLQKLFELAEPPAFPARYNLAPTQELLAVCPGPGGRRARAMKWGLEAKWSRQGKRTLLVNARAETADEKPAFREALRHRRCLVPADGFFEWRREGRTRQPYLIRLQPPEPMAIGAIFEAGPEGDRCVLLTTAANELVAPIHDRMPLILPRAAQAVWLNPSASPENLQALALPFPAAGMAMEPVDTRVNDVRNEDPGLVEPVKPLTLF